jgi:hypothetical protein
MGSLDGRCVIERQGNQRFCWSEPMWSPPPESNRRPHPYHGTTRNRCAERPFPRSRPTVGAEVIGSLSAKLCALLKPCTGRLGAVTNPLETTSPAPVPVNPGSIQQLPRWGPLVGSAHPIVSLLRPAQAIAPRTMDRRGRAGASRRRPLTLWRGRLHGPSSSYPADLRGWSERCPSAARGVSSGGQLRASPG